MIYLKFRGKNITNGDWFYGGGIDSQRDTPLIINHGERIAVDSQTVGVFTGSKDKNGREIYTGDTYYQSILAKHPTAGQHGGTYWIKCLVVVVQCSGGYATKYLKHMKGKYQPEYSSDYFAGGIFSFENFNDVEVIGNIHTKDQMK